MGITSNKATRRSTIGSVAAAFVGMALVFPEVDITNVASASETIKIPLTYYGTTITVEVPRGADQAARRAIAEERIKNDPRLVEARELAMKEWDEEALRKRLGDREKAASIGQVKASAAAIRERAKRLLDSLKE